MTRLVAFWDYLRGTYWALPSAMTVTAVGLSLALIQVDRATTELLDDSKWVYTGDADGARSLLSTVAASMITVAGVAFSITIVALTLASQQFGPRLLRNFLRDVGNQVVLGTFVATFVYCLLVLRAVRGNGEEIFVPQLAVTIGVALATVSLGVFIYFIHHVSTSIQATQIIASVAADLERAIDRLFPERMGENAEEASPEEPAAFDPAAGWSVESATAGYVQAADSDGLLALARARDVVVQLHVRPGDFVGKGRLLLSVHPAPSPADRDPGPLRKLLIIGAERTATQDVAFLFNQLAELAVRALSPGINDPETARSCLDRLEQALCQLAGRRIPSRRRYDSSGTLRVMAAPVRFADIADDVLGEIGRYGRSSVTVTCRLLEAVERVAPCTRRHEDRQVLRRLAAAVADRTRDQGFAEEDRRRIAALHLSATRALLPPAHDDAG